MRNKAISEENVPPVRDRKKEVEEEEEEDEGEKLAEWGRRQRAFQLISCGTRPSRLRFSLDVLRPFRLQIVNLIPACGVNEGTGRSSHWP